MMVLPIQLMADASAPDVALCAGATAMPVIGDQLGGDQMCLLTFTTTFPMIYIINC